MKIAICEDERLFQQKLKSGIERFFAEKQTETTFDCFVNGDELIHNLKNEYDVIFLDIHLGTKTDGMAIAEQLRSAEVSSPVIFVTSFENRAIDGYDVGAYGFVVKKHLEEKLPKVLTKLWKDNFYRPTILIQGREDTAIIKLNHIISVQSQNRATIIQTDTAELTDIRPIGKFT